MPKCNNGNIAEKKKETRQSSIRQMRSYSTFTSHHSGGTDNSNVGRMRTDAGEDGKSTNSIHIDRGRGDEP
uniref:Uncharacterized protein n=1 Tax=Pristionchus pacificus TaxID=54126 RepID=A0A2A6CU92_PRIPA|eukprot:PDM81613.1 hypothetical protein PRIPAC_30594 [Pristionchus pacificus]